MDKLKKLEKYIEENRDRAIKHADKVWNIKRFEEQDIFYMVIFCLLVPGGRAKRAEKAVERLKEFNYCYAHMSDHKLLRVLKPLVRFPKQKFERVKEFKKNKTRIIAEIKELHQNTSDLAEIREYLVKTIKGFGYKASSHFLRNMGNKELAIIDVHVLKYRQYFMPEDLVDLKPSTEKNYKILEKHFNTWAKSFKLKPAYLDWFLWCLEAKVDVEEMDK